jgi:hypothetical protein
MFISRCRGAARIRGFLVKPVMAKKALDQAGGEVRRIFQKWKERAKI